MNNLSKKLKTSVGNLKLSNDEKARMRVNISSFLTDSTAKQQPSAFNKLRIVSPYFFGILRSPLAVSISSGLLVLIILTSGAFSANGSLPGDILYPIKINFNEPLEGVFAFSDEAKVKWHAEIITERLKEVGQLAAEGKLTAETVQDIKPDFDAHVEEALTLSRKGQTAEASLKSAAIPAPEVVSTMKMSLPAESDSAPRSSSLSASMFRKDNESATASSLENLYESLRKTLDASSTASFDAQIETAKNVTSREDNATTTTPATVRKNRKNLQTDLLINTLMDANTEFKKSIMHVESKLKVEQQKNFDDGSSSYNKSDEKSWSKSNRAAVVEAEDREIASSTQNLATTSENFRVNSTSSTPTDTKPKTSSSTKDSEEESESGQKSSIFLKEFLKNRR